MPPKASLRGLLASSGLIEVPGAHDALSALLVQRTGFDAVLLGGGATAAFGYGLPDIGLLSMTEVIDQIRKVAAVVDIPIIADLDDGGGIPVRVRRAVQAAEQAGAAAVMIEDVDSSGKHLWSEQVGGLDFATEQLQPIRAAVANVAAAVDARRSADTVVVARTDALMVQGLEAALVRAEAFVDAGADVVFLTHLPAEKIRAVTGRIAVPLLNIVFDTPKARRRETLARHGLRIAVYPLHSMISAYRGVEAALLALKSGRPDNGDRPLLEEYRGIVEEVNLKGWTELLAAHHPTKP